MAKILVHYNEKQFELPCVFHIDYDDLYGLIQGRFGQIKNLLKKISYKYQNEVFFISDDVDLQRAYQAFPQRLQLLIRSDSDDIYKDYCRSCMEMEICRGEIPCQNVQEWTQNIKKKGKIAHHQYQINNQLLGEIERSWSGRLGHSDDPIGSFLMGFYWKQAKKLGIQHKQIDKSIWKLDEWRKRKLGLLIHDSQTSMPILSLPSVISKKIPQNSNTSYLFSNPKKNIKSISSITREGGLKLAKEHTKFSEDYADHIRYYLHDGIYHLLTQASLGVPSEKAFKAFINETRKFSGHDSAFAAHIQNAWNEYSKGGVIYHPPIDDQSGIVPEFNDNDVIGVLGDWGTSLQDSFDLLDYLVFNQGATVILHIGDVYYAGFPEQYAPISQKLNNLQRLKPNLRYYAIAGNHDYYTFGGPYYDSLKKNHLKQQFIQQFGFFCLRNKSKTIQFIGLNTGRYNGDIKITQSHFYQGTKLVDEQLSWAQKKINEFSGKTVLLTHHPYFSNIKKAVGKKSDMGLKNPQINPNLASQLFEVLPKITCWMWGHEHRFTTYKPKSFGVNRTVLAGNSAIQIDDDDYYQVKYPNGGNAVDKYQPTKGTSPTDNGWYNHTGIALSNFIKDQNIKAKYIYMTASYDQKSVMTREENDQYAAPVQLDVRFNEIYQILEESGLSLAISDRVWLNSEPTDIQIIDPSNPNANGKVSSSQDVLIRAVGTNNYVYFKETQVMFENFDKSSEKKLFYWKLQKTQDSLRSGDIFSLFNVAAQKSFGSYFVTDQQEYRLSNIKSSRFQLYQREK